MGIYCNGISIGLEMGYIYNFYNQQYLIGCVRNVKLPITDDIIYILLYYMISSTFWGYSGYSTIFSDEPKWLTSLKVSKRLYTNVFCKLQACQNLNKLHVFSFVCVFVFVFVFWLTKHVTNDYILQYLWAILVWLSSTLLFLVGWMPALVSCRKICPQTCQLRVDLRLAMKKRWASI